MNLRFTTIFGLIALLLLAACTTTVSPTFSIPPAPTLPAVTMTPQATVAPVDGATPVETPSPILPPSPQPQPTSEAGPGSVLTDSQHGLTITITNIEFTETATIVNYEAAVDPRWGFTFESDAIPPQRVFPGAKYPEAVIIDETGQSHEQREKEFELWHVGRVDPVTKIAYTGGQFVFGPVSGNELNIQLKFGLMSIRAEAPIRLEIPNPELDQILPIQQSFTFGELTTEVKSANWFDGNTFELTLAGTERDGLILNCVYIYTDPTVISPGHKTCYLTAGLADDRPAQMILDPLPTSSEAVEVYVSADVDLTEPFLFKWMRSDS